MTSDEPRLVCLLDDDPGIRDALSSLLRSEGYRVETFSEPQALLDRAPFGDWACLLLDIRLDETDGLDFQDRLIALGIGIPVILMTGAGDIPMTVRAMKAGAVDFLTKPAKPEALFRAINEAFASIAARRRQMTSARQLSARFETLTPREREVMTLVSQGLMNKQIAGRLNLSEVTVKIHRGRVMRKMDAASVAQLVRMSDKLISPKETT